MRVAHLAVIALVAGCSAIVGGTGIEENIPCEQAEGAPNPCAEIGMICLDGRCVSDTTCIPECTAPEICIEGMCRPPLLEVCNGMDDDFDGTADEGLRNDEDADNFYTCDVDPLLIDCVDRAGLVGASIFPGAPEICDGFDNDCDPSTLDGTVGCDGGGTVCARPFGGTTPECLMLGGCRLNGCADNEYCDGATDRCVIEVPPTDCTMAGMSCRAGERCNTTTLLCEPIRDLVIGAPCGSDAECASGACYPYSALDLTDQPGGIGLCGAPCCTSSECGGLGPDLVCWAPGTGARSCMPRTVVGDGADAPVCVGRGGCSGGTCRLGSVARGESSFAAFTCGGGVGSSFIDCDTDSDCFQGLCVEGICRPPCGSQDDCGIFDCDIPILCSQVGICAYYNRAGDWVTACSGNSPSRGAAGAGCTGDAQCQERYCHVEGSDRRCSATCCNDADCGDALRCRPVDHFGWEMRCLPASVAVPG